MRTGSYLLVVKRRRSILEVWKKRVLPPLQYRLVDIHVISLGKEGYETAAGVYWIQNRARYPEWRKPDSEWVSEDQRGVVVPGDKPDDPHPENPLKEAWLGLMADKGVGIHGTADIKSLGSPKSHGCVRVDPLVAVDLHDRVRVGTPVVIF